MSSQEGERFERQVQWTHRLGHSHWTVRTVDSGPTPQAPPGGQETVFRPSQGLDGIEVVKESHQTFSLQRCVETWCRCR